MAVEVDAPAIGGRKEGEEVGQQVAHEGDEGVVIAERTAGELRRVAPLVGEQLVVIRNWVGCVVGSSWK